VKTDHNVAMLNAMQNYAELQDFSSIRLSADTQDTQNDAQAQAKAQAQGGHRGFIIGSVPAQMSDEKAAPKNSRINTPLSGSRGLFGTPRGRGRGRSRSLGQYTREGQSFSIMGGLRKIARRDLSSSCMEISPLLNGSAYTKVSYVFGLDAKMFSYSSLESSLPDTHEFKSILLAKRLFQKRKKFKELNASDGAVIGGLLIEDIEGIGNWMTRTKENSFATFERNIKKMHEAYTGELVSERASERVSEASCERSHN